MSLAGACRLSLRRTRSLPLRDGCDGSKTLLPAPQTHARLGAAPQAPGLRWGPLAVTRSSLTVEWGKPRDRYHKPRPPAPCSSARTTLPALHTQPRDPRLPAPVYADTLSTAPQLCALPEAALSPLVSKSHSTLAQQVPKELRLALGLPPSQKGEPTPTQRSIGPAWRSPTPGLFSRAHTLPAACRAAPAQHPWPGLL